MKYFLAICGLIFSLNIQANSVEIESFELVKSKRVNIKEYVLEYRVKIKNNGVDAEGLVATISTADESIALIDDSLTFDSISSGDIAESIDTFSVRKDRTTKFEPSSLTFDFSD